MNTFFVLPSLYSVLRYKTIMYAYYLLNSLKEPYKKGRENSVVIKKHEIMGVM